MESAPARPEGAALPDSQAERDLLVRFSDAFEGGDIDALVALMTEDAWIRMPPEPFEYQGHEAIAGFIRTRSIWQPGVELQLVPTRANGQPAFGYYMRDPRTGIARAEGLMVLTLEGDRLCAADALRRHRRVPVLRPAADDPGRAVSVTGPGAGPAPARRT